MKTVILAGGWGSRLGSLTNDIPKPMVKIGNIPIIEHIMNIYSTYGYNDFIICLGVKGDMIKNYFYNYNLLNNDFTLDMTTNKITYLNKETNKQWSITLVNTGLDTPKGGRLKLVEKYLDNINMITYGDSLANININDLVNFHKTNNKIITITGVYQPGRFGEITENGEFKEKSENKTQLINGGFMIFNKELLNYLTIDSEFEMDVLEDLSRKGNVGIYKHMGEWECMDHERDYIYLNKLWNENKAFWIQ